VAKQYTGKALLPLQGNTFNTFIFLTHKNLHNTLLRFHGNNGCANAAQYYVTRTVPLVFHDGSLQWFIMSHLIIISIRNMSGFNIIEKL
jgi:hypothetical protein